ncbi:MAG TPA: AAA family ATPase [Candidatus Accumulibacter phosphatis]|nr:MAG: Flagellum site-determining protein YlxH [Candidatus Accumulibacter sp. SK-11]HCN67505.1 MinD-like protein [Accumulibacter sp.]HCV12361.1 MinD-like protein [Accumulibacter sp.]HRL74816.1 AAA family ATPase [Candidatus Accumulibacter phosphatis]HRQ95015.1 AAA family ATPase [Candidatus Accumulibacter phosphatis]
MADFRGDQAAGLRRLLGRPQLRVVTFAAGGRGVGQSVSVANLAASLARVGREVLVVDENAESGVAAFFGAFAASDLQQVITQEKRLEEVLVQAAPGIRVLPAARIVGQLGLLSEPEQRTLLGCLTELLPPADVVLVDSSVDHPLGFSPLGLAAHETVVVVSTDVTAITEAYALIKKVSLGYAHRRFRILINRARSDADARAIHDNMARVTDSRRLAHLDYAGCVPIDEHLRQASRLCQPVAALFPEAPAAEAYRLLAERLLNWPLSSDEPGGLEHFVQLLLHLSQRIHATAIYA